MTEQYFLNTYIYLRSEFGVTHFQDGRSYKTCHDGCVGQNEPRGAR